MLQRREISEERVNSFFQELGENWEKEDLRKKEIKEGDSYIKWILDFLGRYETIDSTIQLDPKFTEEDVSNIQDLHLFYDIVREYAEKCFVKDIYNAYIISYNNIEFIIVCLHALGEPIYLLGKAKKYIRNFEETAISLQINKEVILYENIVNNIISETNKKRQECIREIQEKLKEAKELGISEVQLERVLEEFFDNELEK